MKLSEMQKEVLKRLLQGPLWPAGLQVGTCKALERRGLAEKTDSHHYRITAAGREAAR